MVDRRVPSPVLRERIWQCKECDLEVESVLQPKPCPDHPFSEMLEVED
jgi:ABC-type ATPase with predicted acetyltransferase domain